MVALQMERQTLLESITARLPGAVVVVDDEQRYVFANAAADELFGVAEGGLIGRTISDFAPADADVAARWASFRNDEVPAGEWVIRRPDDTLVATEYSAVADIAPGLHLALLRDIRDRKRTDQAIRASEELYSRVFHGSPAAMAVTSFDDFGIYSDVNTAFLDMTGFWRSEVIGHGAADLNIWVDSALRERVGGLLAQRGAAANVRGEYRTKSGAVRHGVASFSVLELAAGRFVLTVLQDVTP